MTDAGRLGNEAYHSLDRDIEAQSTTRVIRFVVVRRPIELETRTRVELDGFHFSPSRA